MSELNPNAQKWVDALRSGEFKQTSGFLRSGDAYCCLGVACVVAERDGVDVNLSPMQNSAGLGDPFFGGVSQWLRMRPGTEIGEYGEGMALAWDNDDGKSFAEIADIIEAHADELFEEAV